ncbi:MAG: ATP-binding cassette domain-containing protein [Pseudomonadota bacterium]|nr:ATP-binding cassette domain-containing protein [Pseudomonadota bacterium]
MTGPAPILFANVSKTFLKHDGTPFFACRELSFEVKAREIVAIVGETGCGKSTSFNMLLGLQKPDVGDIQVLGLDPFSESDALRGQVGIIFQNDRLLPWRTAIENISFGLEVLNIPLTQRRQTAEKWLERVGLKGFADAYPHELSGGMRQRVSIARAFAIEPKILYADEAFTALDELTAERIRKDLLELIRETAITTLFITHSVAEAVDIAQRILVFGRPGCLISEIDCEENRATGKSTHEIEQLIRESLRIAHETIPTEEVGRADGVASKERESI